jgi:hypothetical protein
VKSPHVLAGSFRANENGCRVSRGIDRKCSEGKEARTRSLQEWRDGKERVGENRIGGRPKGDREGEPGKVKVATGLGRKEGTIGEGERHGL